MFDRRPSGVRRAACVLVAATATVTLAGCGGPSSQGSMVSTFDLKVGDCLNPPQKVQAELSSVHVVPCTTPHTEEAYAIADYSGAGSGSGTVYPGDAVVQKFAEGTCEQRYQGYVGDSYADSKYFFTYLLPSARSWQAGDRSVICIFTTTGQLLSRSVKGSKV